jgi:protein TonB
MELVSLYSTHPDKRRMSFKKMASVVVHVLLIAALTYEFRGVSAKVRKDKPVARILVPYAPGRRAVAQPPKPKIVRPKQEPILAMKQPEPPPPSSGGDPSGEADVTVAMADFYPAPKPDLSALPHGTRGDVVLLIVIDETGKVVDAHIDQGIGHGVDEAVMAVVQTWTFTPATKAGKPVASEQQLLFHFERT